MKEVFILLFIPLSALILCANGQMQDLGENTQDFQPVKRPTWRQWLMANMRVIKKLTTGDIYKGKGVKQNVVEDNEDSGANRMLQKAPDKEEEDKPLKAALNDLGVVNPEDQTEPKEPSPPKPTKQADFVKPGDIIRGQYRRAFDTTGGDFNAFYEKFQKDRLKGFNTWGNQNCPRNFPAQSPPQWTGLGFRDSHSNHFQTIEQGQFNND